MSKHLFRSDKPPVEISELNSSDFEDELKPAVESFRLNLQRVTAAMSLAEHAAICGMIAGEAIARVKIKHFDRPYITASDTVSLAFYDDVKAEIDRPNPNPGGNVSATAIPWGSLFNNLGFREASAAAAVFESQIINAWTAVETLAMDVWIITVNSFPDPLAKLSGKSDRLTGGGSVSEEGRTASAKKTIPLNLIHEVTRGNFDLGKKMAELLIASNRVKLTSLRGIREAYAMSFQTKSSEIDEALLSKKLDAISMVRNMIVHCAAKADARYVADIKFVPDAPKLSIGEELKLNADEARSLSDGAIMCAINLAKAVDQWMKRSRKKLPT